MTAPIVNGESGFVVRAKLNLIIEPVDTLVASGGGVECSEGPRTAEGGGGGGGRG